MKLIYFYVLDLYHHSAALESSCSTFLLIASVLGFLLFVSEFVMCYLASRLHGYITERFRNGNVGIGQCDTVTTRDGYTGHRSALE